jgi:predicted alpha/beta-hydrolase family hydrolase
VTNDPGAEPALLTLQPHGDVRGVALLAHGGRSRSTAPTGTMQPTALRMYPFLLDLHRAGRSAGLAACQLRYRLRGYNEGDPVRDVEWALGEIAERHGDVPVCMVGHSMGGRSVLRAAGGAHVRAVAALAPWLPPGEPIQQVQGRTVVIAHGTRDRVTSPAGSLAYALAAHDVAERLCRFEVARSGHAMLERFGAWQRLVRRTVLPAVGIGAWDEGLASAFSLPAADACRVPL